MKIDGDGFFVFPEEYVVPIPSRCCVSCVVSVGRKDGKLYPVGAIIWDENSNQIDIGETLPSVKHTAFTTLNSALEGAVGRLIDVAVSWSLDAAIVNSLKDYLSFLAKGGVPQRVKEADAKSGDDPSF